MKIALRIPEPGAFHLWDWRDRSTGSNLRVEAEAAVDSLSKHEQLPTQLRAAWSAEGVKLVNISMSLKGLQS